MENLVNKTLGQFQIRRELGRGGMAVVYEAYQPALQRTVALKVLPPGLGQDAAFARRFQQEAIAAAGLRHPNIVTIYDVGAQDPYSFIVMEYLEGRALSDIIRDEGALPLARAAKILEQVAQALDYAHQRGFVHRDIKPGNVMVNREGHATLTDFGIARAVTGTHLTQTGAIIGTPEYMAPEQIRGAPVDHRADIYALGILAYEMLTGRVPFSGDTATVLYKQVHEPPPPLEALLSHAPPFAVAAVARALVKDPNQRFQTASEFTAALAGAHAAAGIPPTAQMSAGAPPQQASTQPTPLPTYYTPLPFAPAPAPPPASQRARGGLPGWLPWLIGGAGAALLICAIAIGVVVLAGGQLFPTPSRTTAADVTPGVTVAPATPIPATGGATQPLPATPATRSTPTLTRAQIERAIQETIERFQKAKEHSQKTGDTSRLSQDLAGQALERQIELVEQTKAQNCYWDIWLDAPMEYEFLEVRGDNYVRVKVTKTETRHKYCDNKLVSSSSADKDTYSTNYVVELINGKWYVTQRE